MRKLIAGVKISLDGKIEGTDGYADWVDAWSEEYGLIDEIDACLLGAGMYTGYEQYWSAILKNEAGKPLPMTGKEPTKEEFKWAKFAEQTPHYVLTNKINSALWTNTRLISGINEVIKLKQTNGKNIYLMGGAKIIQSLINNDLVDELRLIIYPIIVSKGKGLLENIVKSHKLKLDQVEQLGNGRLKLTYNFVA